MVQLGLPIVHPVVQEWARYIVRKTRAGFVIFFGGEFMEVDSSGCLIA